MDIFYWREKLASFWFSSSSIPQQRFSCFPFSSFVYSLFFFLVVIYNFNYVCSPESFYKRQFRENCSVSMISLRWNPKWLKLIYINLVQKMTSIGRFSYYLYPICWWKFILKRETKTEWWFKCPGEAKWIQILRKAHEMISDSRYFLEIDHFLGRYLNNILDIESTQRW